MQGEETVTFLTWNQSIFLWVVLFPLSFGVFGGFSSLTVVELSYETLEQGFEALLSILGAGWRVCVCGICKIGAVLMYIKSMTFAVT